MPTLFEDRKLQLARINQLAIVVSLIFLILLGRLWYLQIALGDQLLVQSESNRVKLLRTRAPRGTILDRKGRILATSRPQFVVMVNPEEIRGKPEAMQTLCGILQTTAKDIEDTIADSEARPGSPVRIAVDVPMDVIVRIGELRMKLPGVSVELDNLRYYPDGHAVAHIMGQLGEIGKTELEESTKANKGYRPGDYVGKAGLEKQYEEYLRGIDGGKKIEVNAMGRAVRILGDPKPSVPGKTVKLSIDRDLQVAGERAIGDRVGAVVAIDPRDGSVLAMVSKPSYDANVFVKKIKQADWKQISGNPQHPLQNRSVQNVYPPGSIFKPLIAMAGLHHNECSSKTTVSCPGYFMFGRRFGCWTSHGSGIDFDKAMMGSCDVWYYQLGLRLGVDRLAQFVRQFGISHPTGVDLPTEAKGTMPDTEWKRRAYRNRPESERKWYPGETPSVSIGQGAVQTSPLQMAVAISGVANNGKIFRPRLMDEVIEPDNSGTVIVRSKPEVLRTVETKPEYFEMVRNALRRTVAEGTGRGCNLTDIPVGGKTGSAQNQRKGVWMPAHGWFVAVAPIDNPEIVIACIVEHGKSGSASAAPVCRALLEVFYGIKKPEEIGQGNARVRGD